MAERFNVYFDAFTGRPKVCTGEVPEKADFIAAFCEEGDAARLLSELASARVVELGIVSRNPVVDGQREQRVQALYHRALDVGQAAPFVAAGRKRTGAPAARRLPAATPSAVTTQPALGAAAAAGLGQRSWSHGFVLPAEPPI
jgi:hypothetical protein